MQFEGNCPCNCRDKGCAVTTALRNRGQGEGGGGLQKIDDLGCVLEKGWLETKRERYKGVNKRRDDSGRRE